MVLDNPHPSVLDNPHPQGTTVFLEEEYGYRYYIWHTGMSEEELVNYWESIEDINCLSIHTLPGKLVAFNGSYDERPSTKWYAHHHTNLDSELEWNDPENGVYKSYHHKKAGSYD